jgi:hypothetical protein
LNNTGDKPQINAMMNAKYVGRTAVPPLPPMLIKTIINIEYEEIKYYIIFKNRAGVWGLAPF